MRRGSGPTGVGRRVRAVLVALLAAAAAIIGPDAGGTPGAAAGESSPPVRDVRDALRADTPGPGLTGYLGVVTESSVSGVRVTRVVPGSPADDAGLRAGDLIRSLGRDPVDAADDLDRALAFRRPGETVAVAAVRSGAPVALTVRLSARRVRDGIFRGPVFRLAVVPLRFSGDRSPPPDAAVLRRLLFDRTGRTGAGASMADYLAGQSWDRFAVEGDVLEPITLPGTRARYADLPMGTPDGSAYQVAADLLRARAGDAALQDFDGVAFLYGGAPERRAGFALWPHRSTVVVGARRIPYYVHGTDSDEGRSIGVHCHEFLHLLGLPDTYGAGHRTGAGDFCLMAIGHRGGGATGDDAPFSVCAHCRMRLGWLEPVAVDPRTPQRLRLAPVGSGPQEALLVPLDARCDEYLVLENRSRAGFDAEIPSAGLLVWHAGGTPTPGQGIYASPVDLIEAHGVDVFDASLVRIDEIAFPTARARDLTARTQPYLRPASARSFPCSLTDIVRTADGSILLTLGVARDVRQAPPAPYDVGTPDAEGYVVRKDPVTGEDARFYVGPRDGAPAAPPATTPGQQRR